MVPGNIKRTTALFPDFGNHFKEAGVTCRTTVADDRYIVATLKRNIPAMAGQVANELHADKGTPISRKTVSRRLRQAGWPACVPLTRKQHSLCLQLCRQHHNWTVRTTEHLCSSRMRLDSVFHLSVDSSWSVMRVVLPQNIYERHPYGFVSTIKHMLTQ